AVFLILLPPPPRSPLFPYTTLFRSGTAAGVTFLSLEDETGILNVICSAGLWQRYRKVVRSSAALVVRGTVESADGVTNLMADRVQALSLRVPSTSRDFR